MSFKALVIGGGSIGKRHIEILKGMDKCSDLVVLTKQMNLPYKTISSIDHALEFNPDYIVVCSATNKHFSQLQYLETHFKEKKILIEKPLFDSQMELKINNNAVYVGYNLRFHPILQKIKEVISERSIWNIHIFCGSFLPEWRPSIDYRKSSSASKKTGGGVLLDLSHELDYTQWLFGSIELKYILNKKVSDLMIDSDDILLLSGYSGKGASLHLALNYFTRKPLRQIIIDGEGISIQGDLNSNILHVVKDDKVYDYSYSELKHNDTYHAQHEAIINNDKSLVCTYDQGIQTMELIDKIRSFNN